MARMVVIRNVAPEDLDWVRALNTANEAETSPLGLGEMASLLDRASHARVVEPDAAFMIAFDQDGEYDSPNFLWFRDRFERFLYVDRIVVSANYRRQGLARHLYDDLFRHARQSGYPLVTAEINARPPNPASDAFHADLGFLTVGEARLEDRGKTVRYIARDLTEG